MFFFSILRRIKERQIDFTLAPESFLVFFLIFFFLTSLSAYCVLTLLASELVIILFSSLVVIYFDVIITEAFELFLYRVLTTIQISYIWTRLLGYFRLICSFINSYDSVKSERRLKRTNWLLLLTTTALNRVFKLFLFILLCFLLISIWSYSVQTSIVPDSPISFIHEPLFYSSYEGFWKPFFKRYFTRF